MGITSGGAAPTGGGVTQPSPTEVRIRSTESHDTSRTNGFQFPLHYLQIIAWALLLMLAIFYFSTVDPSLQDRTLRIIMRSILIAFLVMHTFFHATATFIDPADPSVREKHRRALAELGGKPFVPKFNREVNSHVIENQYCNLCEVKVGPKSKHCSSCNKCISTFDHHCKWLNNCVGDQNYRYFLATLVTSMLCSLIVVCTTLMLFIAFYTDTDSGLLLNQYHDVYELLRLGNITNSIDADIFTEFNTTQSIQADTLVDLAEFRVLNIRCTYSIWLAANFISFLLSLIGLILLSHLFGFHIFINYKGLTTYEYIIKGREKSDSVSKSKSRCNKVTPQTSEYELTTAPYIGRPSNSKLQDYNRQGEFMSNNNTRRLYPKHDNNAPPHSISNLSLYMETKKYPGSVDTTPPMVRNKDSFSDLDELTLDGTSIGNLEDVNNKLKESCNKETEAVKTVKTST